MDDALHYLGVLVSKNKQFSPSARQGQIFAYTYLVAYLGIY